jgi:hypothetical protein
VPAVPAGLRGPCLSGRSGLAPAGFTAEGPASAGCGRRWRCSGRVRRSELTRAPPGAGAGGPPARWLADGGALTGVASMREGHR